MRRPRRRPLAAAHDIFLGRTVALAPVTTPVTSVTVTLATAAPTFRLRPDRGSGPYQKQRSGSQGLTSMAVGAGVAR